MTAFAKSSAGIRPTVLKAFRPDSIKKKQWGTLPVLGRCALVLNGIANLFCPTCRTNTRCGRPGFFNISASSSCSSKNFSFKWTIVIRLTFSSNKKKPFFIFSYKKRQKLAFLFYLRWRPTTLFHQFGLSFFSQVATCHPVADYNIQKYLSKINKEPGFSYKKTHLK